MKKYAPVWTLLGILLAGCGTTGKTVETISAEEKEVYAVTDGFRAAKTFEELDALTTPDAVFVSSYLSAGGTGERKFTDKKAYWKTLSAKRSGDMAVRSINLKDLKIAISGNNAEVTYVSEVIRVGGGDRPWRGEVFYLFKLRKEGGTWKIYFFQQ